MAESLQYVTLYGRLEDKFGDNGLVSVVIGEVQNKVLHIRLWLMSCRVLKRGMEDAMMNALVAQAKQNNVAILRGYYYKTAKNTMVEDFYAQYGFEKIAKEENGDAVWQLDVAAYRAKSPKIEVKGQ